jgi:hypothetical protein
LEPAPQRKEAGIAPAIVEGKPPAHAEAVSPPPETKTVPSAIGKSRGKAPLPVYKSITKTEMPRPVSRNPLFSIENKTAATLRKIFPSPAEVASATPPWTKTASSVSETGRNEAVSPPEASIANAATPAGVDFKPAPSRENKEAGIVMQTSREEFSARQPGRNSKKPLPNDDRTPPVEVHVSIGHIEVKSAQPNVPAPRRTPPRPRVTLEEFLKHPHYGGPR